MSTEKSSYSRRLSNGQRNLIDWKLIRKSPHRTKLCLKDQIITWKSSNHPSAKEKTHIYALWWLNKAKKLWKWCPLRENLLRKADWSKVLTQWRDLRSVKLSWLARQKVALTKWSKCKMVIDWKTITRRHCRQTMTKSLPLSWQPRRLQTMHHHAKPRRQPSINSNSKLTVWASYRPNWAKSRQKRPMKKGEFQSRSTLPQTPQKRGTRHRPVRDTKSNSIDWEQFRICRILRRREADIIEAQVMTDMGTWHQF